MAATEGFINKLCSLLVLEEIVPVARAKELRDLFAESEHERFTQFLVEEGLLSRSVVLHVLSQLYQVPMFDVSGHFFDHFLLRQFPKDFLLRSELIPLSHDDNILIVIAADPSNEELLSDFGNYVSYDIRFYVGLGHDIIDAVEEFYDESLTDISADTQEPL